MEPDPKSAARPLHVAIIMDGNGRWARARGWPRLAGHRQGGEAARRVIEVAPDHGIGTLSLYTFSADNWSRPGLEVKAIMELIGDFLQREVSRGVAEGVRVSFIGRRDRLPNRLVQIMKAAESATAAGRRLHLRLAIDYSARDAIVRAAAKLEPGVEPTREELSRLLNEIESPGAAAPDVDLLIRTGGEMRLSDFLLWECAYAEMCFPPVMWPDFGERELEVAVREFQARERRFGGLKERAAS